MLLQGESGVGKELAAEAIHRHSARKDGPLVAVNMAALSPTLAEAELFGHVEGAFTGAVQSRTGLLPQANGGTLLLDEVADIPLPLQLKLLRVLDHGEVLPVGADAPLRSKFRVILRDASRICARRSSRASFVMTCSFGYVRSRSICRRCANGRRIFRCWRIISRHSSVATRRARGRNNHQLQRRPWYGNVCELRNAIEHALVLARRGIVMPEHLPPPLPNLWQSGGAAAAMEGEELADALSRIARHLAADPELAGTVYDRFLQQVEPPLLTAVMDKCGNRFAPAARVLGLHRTTLKKKLTQYEMESVNP